jgi:hypothetical protein
LLQVFMTTIVWWVWYALTKTLMRPGMIEIRDVFPDDAVQVTLNQDQEVIQTFASHAADEAITDHVSFRCSYRCPENVDPSVFRHAREAWSILAVIIPDQKAGSFIVRRSFSHLLGDPEITRRPCDSVMHHAARPQLDSEEHKDRAEKQVIGLHKIAGPVLPGLDGR